MLSNTKIAVFSLLILFSLIFIAYENKFILLNVSNAKTQYITIYENSKEASFRLAEPRQWVINNLVAHYAPRIIIKDKNRLVFEALAFYDHINQTIEYVIRNVNFLILFAQNGDDSTVEKLFLKIDDASGIETNINVGGVKRLFWKFRSEIEVNIELIDLNRTVVLLTDVGEYERLRLVAQEDLKRSLTFHKPFVYDSRVRKKAAIGHCVHMIRDLDKRKLLQMKNWLSVQQRLGIDWVKLYFSKVSEESESEVRKFISAISGNMTIEIVDFGFPKYEKTCEAQLSLSNSNSKSVRNDYILNQCREFFFTHMGDHWPGHHAQESVCTNDCFASFKYTHEFVTNYDFDEFILPRKFLPTHNLTFAQEDLKCTPPPNKLAVPNESDYNLYNYITQFISQTNSSKVASLHFEHMLLLEFMPDSFIKDLYSVSNQTRTIAFNYNNMRINFNIDPLKDSNMINSMRNQNLSRLIECLDTFINISKINYKWNRLHGIWMDVRRGKSVFNTNYTEFITQHSAFQINDKSASSIDVPIDYGFVSHFREPIDIQFFLGQTYAFNKHYRLDIEYYYFMAAFFQNTFNFK